ncbi:TIGR02757 family protein [Helicobacter didelphidarum]|uniref:TIGR02757 family protein n=2 Tax=Helicobacter didelphidarum TaxID=2040648 RepID=A0A3D8IPE4_9HELI|nr:TIGR02757 family protein [Helicobacter didelphidarum]
MQSNVANKKSNNAFKKKLRNKKDLKFFLDTQYTSFNAQKYLYVYPDPLMVVYRYKDFQYFDEVAFICAIYSYGNATLIVKNLGEMPFSFLLDSKALQTSTAECFPYYRFQTRQDTRTCFLIISHLISLGGIKQIFLQGYRKNHNILDGIQALQKQCWDFIQKHQLQTHGIEFLFGNPNINTSPLKRYNMFLRWMVRKDSIDFGLWSEIPCHALLLPLDTHTFKIAKMLGLCTTKSYSRKAVLEITNNLKDFDSQDPIKYDFALYRIGQLKLHLSL